MYKLVQDNDEMWIIPTDREDEWWEWYNNGIIKWDENYPDYAVLVPHLACLTIHDYTMISIAELPKELLYGKNNV